MADREAKLHPGLAGCRSFGRRPYRAVVQCDVEVDEYPAQLLQDGALCCHLEADLASLFGTAPRSKHMGFGPVRIKEEEEEEEKLHQSFSRSYF